MASSVLFALVEHLLKPTTVDSISACLVKQMSIPCSAISAGHFDSDTTTPLSYLIKSAQEHTTNTLSLSVRANASATRTLDAPSVSALMDELGYDLSPSEVEARTEVYLKSSDALCASRIRIDVIF